MRLVEYEAELKKMIEKDRSDPKVYIAIYELIYRWLLREKHMLDRQKVADISCDMAEDLYMKICSGENITSWIGYIKKLFISYWKKWQFANVKAKIIDIPNFSFELALVQMYAGSTLYDDSIAMIVNSDVLRSIPKMLETVLDNSRYYKDTPEYLNAHISLLLSIRLGSYVSFRQTEENSKYTRLLYRVFLDKLASELAPSVENTSDIAIRFHQVETFDYMSGGGEIWQIY